MAILLALCAGAAAMFSPTKDPNMNGEYLLSVTPGAPKDKTFSTDFKDYPGGAEYFDVYHGPITTLYSQVWWTSTANDIPDEIKKRFDGKVRAPCLSLSCSSGSRLGFALLSSKLVYSLNSL
jgi:hypothetical protein